MIVFIHLGYTQMLSKLFGGRKVDIRYGSHLGAGHIVFEVVGMQLPNSARSDDSDSQFLIHDDFPAFLQYFFASFKCSICSCQASRLVPLDETSGVPTRHHAP